MKLLIVDDQQATLTGMATGIPWGAIGFTQVETAQNAMEARIAFSKEVPDVMLCDIEMPVENGIEFCHWVRARGDQTKIIFLTCHADFEYAKEAISLNASDYIVQPAPYEEIAAKVKDVVDAIAVSRAQSNLQTIGMQYHDKQMLVNGTLWRSYLTGSLTLEGLLAIPNMPNPSRPAFLILEYLVQWRESDEGWRNGLLAESLRSFVEDIFLPHASCAMSCFVEYNTYSILFQPKGDYSEEQLRGSLQYLVDCYRMYMPCGAMFYIAPACPIAQMPQLFQNMLHMRDLAAPKPGVYAVGQALPALPEYRSHRQQWLLAYQGGISYLRATVLGDLYAMQSAGADNLRNLAAFSDEWLDVAKELQPSLSHKLDTSESSTLLRQAGASVRDLEKLVAFTVDHMEQKADISVTQQIKQYIQENIYKNLRREDIARHVHLNEDYMTRLFKKETGCTLKSYIISQKLLVARQLLQTTSLSVSMVAMQLGYSNYSHFSAAYKKEFGSLPGDGRRSLCPHSGGG